ncbi:hypothetical protein [Nakamurella leprariae]|uniref:Uncharacterized protein n=1 Tax=Nakamurella leprariae TaxID=2803911 RepID=A0A939C369_9ACTN|nr:hypothetical protein [Nakamurella leprariae]MBM9468807.1 hypothetical protein [Nakamurella leprariae]
MSEPLSATVVAHEVPRGHGPTGATWWSSTCHGSRSPTWFTEHVTIGDR